MGNLFNQTTLSGLADRLQVAVREPSSRRLKIYDH